MHIIAYIYLLIKRSLPSFVQFYIAGTARIFPVRKPGKEKHITTCKTDLVSQLSSETSRPISSFHNKLIPQVECFYSDRYWHCKAYFDRQKSRIIRYQLPCFIQSPEMVLLGPNKAQSSGPASQRLLVDPINCLPTLFNFLTPHMRFPSSSHTDVPVLKT